VTTSSNIEIQELKNFISDRFNELKQDVAEIDTKVESIDKRLIVVETKLDNTNQRLSNIETSIQKIPDLAEKVGEFKNWKQVGILLLASIFSGTIGSFIGWIARGFKP
jgi:septal ring factor EnvC (AmiA/AmiB activator)